MAGSTSSRLDRFNSNSVSSRKTETRGRWISVWAERVLFDSARRKFTKCSATSLSSTSFTTSCAVPSAEISLSTPRVCSAKIASTLVTTSATLALLPSVSVRAMLRPILTRKRSTTAFPTGSNPFPTSRPTGAVTAVTYCLLAKRIVESVQVSHHATRIHFFHPRKLD
ncbi:hypothetical protein CI102_2786 [Trichoderma harzianum]|nr:hypothetical protein CI102_2786 [Trichoderma harzianum]